MQLSNVMTAGGASLLTETVHNLTGVPINHYVVIDFNHVNAIVDANAGVSVTLPSTQVSLGYVFHKGVNHLNGLEALAYARQPSLTQTNRMLRQSSLIRAVINKLAREHLLSSPVTMTRVLNALVSMLTVDSTFTNEEILGLSVELGRLMNHAITYVTAPTIVDHHTVVLKPIVSTTLLQAIKDDSIAEFARRFPYTITPVAP
jgi:anionic cell wall polymer biosynthesis LytR-Cps2A-Psr (LCP) family protein